MYSVKHIHFIGIGGIGMSGLAKIMRQQGYTVSGCDTSPNSNTQELENLGCTISPCHNGPLCADTAIDLLVHTTAVKLNHPELQAALARNVTVIHRSQLLAELTRTNYSICVTGSHGKTTTTSLITHIMRSAARDITFLIGGNLNTVGSNAQYGTDQFLIAEADESDRSLLNLFPTIAVVTNSDYEHVDTYRNLHDVTTMFGDFIAKIPFYGTAILCMDNEPLKSLLPLTHGTAITYGHGAHHTWGYDNVELHPTASSYDLYHHGIPLTRVELPIAGIHNVANSVAALAATTQAGLSLEQAITGLSTFTGVDRRFTYKGMFKTISIFDDYGHHPTEIRHTLAVARKATNGKLTVLFQPHRYTRTQVLWKDFIEVFMQSAIDELIITDIHAASESPIEGITSEQLVASIKALNPHFKISYIPFDEKFQHLKQHVYLLEEQEGLLLLQGAGKLNYFPEALFSKQA